MIVAVIIAVKLVEAVAIANMVLDNVMVDPTWVGPMHSDHPRDVVRLFIPLSRTFVPEIKVNELKADVLVIRCPSPETYHFLDIICHCAQNTRAEGIAVSTITRREFFNLRHGVRVRMLRYDTIRILNYKLACAGAGALEDTAILLIEQKPRVACLPILHTPNALASSLYVLWVSLVRPAWGKAAWTAPKPCGNPAFSFVMVRGENNELIYAALIADSERLHPE